MHCFTQDEISKLSKRKQELLNKLKKVQSKLDDKKAESAKLKNKFKVNFLNSVH